MGTVTGEIRDLPSIPTAGGTTARPIFIVGCPRSGTGILHQLVRLHPDAAWITPITSRALSRERFFFERPGTVPLLEQLVRALPNRLTPHFYSGPFDGSLRIPGLPETSEGAAIWNTAVPDGEDDYRTEDDVTEDARRYLSEVVAWHTGTYHRSRFVSKRPQNVLRLRYLKDIFPDAHLVHLVRDGHAVAASILKRRRTSDNPGWWGARPPGWKEQLSRSPIAQCAWQWHRCVAIGRRDGRAVDAERYHELTYEELTRSPQRTLERLLEAADLPAEGFFTPPVLEYLAQLENRNDGWKKRLTPEEQKELRAQFTGNIY